MHQFILPHQCVDAPFPTPHNNWPLSEACKEATCQMEEEPDENVCTLSIPDTLLSPQAYSADLAARRQGAPSLWTL